MAYLLLCDAHGMVGGKHHFYGVFDRIFCPGFPSAHHKAVLAMELVGPPGGDCKVTIVFRDSEENDVIPPLPIEGQLKFSDFGTAAVQVELQGLPLPKPGIFSFKVLQDDQLIGDRILYVEKIRSV